MNYRIISLGLAAFLVAFFAAFFSVTGLSKLFAGASLAVIFMAGSLEFAKLVSASFLYYYWGRINRILRGYLVFGVVVLVLITSLGIYGFLTSAYQTTALELGVMDSQTSTVQMKRDRFNEQLQQFNDERNSLTQSITQLTSGLSNNVSQYVDRTTGQVITTQSSANRVALERQLTAARNQRDGVSVKIEAISDSISVLDNRILEIQQGSKVAGEVGPLKFMAEITGLSMASIVNIFALLIVFVFDPLAVMLVIAFNMALKLERDDKLKEKIEGGKYEIYQDEPPLQTRPNPMSELFNRIREEELYDAEIEDDKTEDEQTKILGDIVQQSNEMGLYDVTEEVVDKEPVVEVDDELAKLQPDYSARGIDLDGDGKIDGYDTNGDGLIDQYTAHPNRAQYVSHQHIVPYYARPDFDWKDKKKWINDQNAVNYWFKHIRSQYPTDFESKTY
jgi:hypothetical protein